ncbi:arginine--tRNA ligase [Candidatus Saccharibacteria bacterium]|nr:arginine--tRNA ligase [Candidatus Saccharibacteria bacterium]
MDYIKNLLREAIGNELEIEVSEAPEFSGADYATNVAMKLAKKIGKNPREVAEEIKGKILEKHAEVGIEVAGPGFLNFILPDEYFKENLQKFGGEEAVFLKNISQDAYSQKTVVTEFSDPNPFKVLHIGHLYTSVVGEAISRLYEFSGAKVIRANFGGDVGLHVAKNIFAVRKHRGEFEEIVRRGVERGRGAREIVEFLGKCYVEGTRAYEDSEEAKAEITKLNKEIFEIVEKNIREGEVAEIYWTGRRASYEYFKEFYKEIGVKFDKFYPESSVAQRGLEEVKKHTPEVYQESEGAVVFRGEEFGLHTRVFINREGLPTYETKDVGLLFTKYEDFKFDESVVVTGNEQSEYMKVVFKSVEQYAPELVEKTRHLTHGMVKLPGAVKMSSRKGNFVRAVDVLEEVFEASGRNKIVALGAIKYAFLKYRIGGDIEFDVEESVSMTGNSGPYLLYSAVRAEKILRGREFHEKLKIREEWKLNQFEKRILKAIGKFPEVVSEATRENAPHIVCNYLFETAQEFSRFYENCVVNGSEFESERRGIVRAFERVMKTGLGILGIEVPEEM